MGIYGDAFIKLEKEFGPPFYVSVNGSPPRNPIFMKEPLRFREEAQPATLIVKEEEVKGKPHTRIYAGKVLTYRMRDDKGKEIHVSERYVGGDELAEQLMRRGRLVEPARLHEELYRLEHNLPPAEKKGSNSHLPAITPELIEAVEGRKKETHRESVLKSLVKRK